MKFSIALFLILFSSISHAEKLIFCVPESIPPYVIKDIQSGIHLDIIKAAFKDRQVQLGFRFVPNSRLKVLFNKGRCNASTQGKKDGTWQYAHFTRFPFMVFHNLAITHLSNAQDISHISMLKNYRVLAWQNANIYLGGDFARMVAENTNYKEFSSHMPADMLALKRVDFIISEPNIFKYFLTKKIKNISYLNLLPSKNYYYFVFDTESSRDQFELGVKHLYSSAKIDKIFTKYKALYDIDRESLHYLDCHYGNITLACH